MSTLRWLLAAALAFAIGSAQAQQVYVSPPSRGQIPGGTGAAANAGNIGERICAPSTCTLVPCTTTTGYSSPIGGANIASNTLTPGTWRIEGYAGVDTSGGALQIFDANVSSTSGGGAGGGPSGSGPGYANAYYGSSGAIQYYIPAQIVYVTTNTLYYTSVIYATLASGTAGLCGGWIATRIQ